MPLTIRQKNIIVTIAVPLVLLVGFVSWASWVGSTDDIESVANQFKPDSSWELEESIVKPPANICIDAKCPYVTKTWSLSSPIKDAGEFQKVAVIDGQKMKLLDECFYFDTPEGREPSNSCDASIIYRGYQVWLFYYGSNTPEQISLIIERPS